MRRASTYVVAAALCLFAAQTAMAGGRGRGLGPGEGDSRETGDIGAMRGPESSPRNNPDFAAFGADWAQYSNVGPLHRHADPDLE